MALEHFLKPYLLNNICFLRRLKIEPSNIKRCNETILVNKPLNFYCSTNRIRKCQYLHTNSVHSKLSVGILNISQRISFVLTSFHQKSFEKMCFCHDKKHSGLAVVTAQNKMTFLNNEKVWTSNDSILKDLKETMTKGREKVDDIIEKENIWTIPNLLCVSRMIMSPVLCLLVLESHHCLALGMFLFAGFTDLADGFIARTFPSQASKIGSFLDPLADKVLVSTVFLTLTYVGIIPVLLTMVIVYRDVVIVAGASYVRYKSLPPPKTVTRYFDATHATVELAPTLISKVNTAIQLSLITASLAAPVFPFVDHQYLQMLWFITALTTIASGVSYIFSKDTYRILNKKKL